MVKKSKKTVTPFNAVKTINAKYGDRTIYKLEEKATVEEVYPTPSYTLNWATGIGGFAKGGYIHQIYGDTGSGKTTLMLGIAAIAQNQGDKVLYIDAEQRFNLSRAIQVGVDHKTLLFSAMNHLEQTFDMIAEVVESGEVDLIILDSLNALTTEAEMTSETGKSDMGRRAQHIGKGIKKIVAAFSKISKTGANPPTFIFSNQQRQSTSCFHGKTRVVLADGTKKPISEIVKNKLSVEVVSYNRKANKFENKKVVNWFDNGKAELFLQFKTTNPTGSGKSQFACTTNHKILQFFPYKNQELYVEAGDLQVGDILVQRVKDYEFSSKQKEMLYGSMLGDGCIRKIGKSKYQFRETHCKEQDEYLKWKMKFFNTYTSGRHKQGGLYLESFISLAFKDMQKSFYGDSNKKNKIPKDIKLTPLTLAVWYQDDGTLSQYGYLGMSTNCFDKESVDLLAKKLQDLGIECKVNQVWKEDNQWVIHIFARSVDRFFEYCGEYIHSSMAYKVPERFHNNIGEWDEYDFDQEKPVYKKIYATINDIYEKPVEPWKENMYDIEVEDNHNFLVDNIVVHNSYGNPEIVPGGKAIEYYSTQILRLQPKAILDYDGTELGSVKSTKDFENNTPSGIKIAHKHMKNSVAMPHKSGSYNLYWDDRVIDHVEEIVALGLMDGHIQQTSMSWYAYSGQKINGKGNLVEFFKDNASAFEQLIKELNLKLLPDYRNVEKANLKLEAN